MLEKYRENYRLIGLKIAYVRRKRGLTQEQLAEKLGSDLSWLAQIEAPNTVRGISLDSVFRIAEALEIEPYKLLMFDD